MSKAIPINNFKSVGMTVTAVHVVERILNKTKHIARRADLNLTIILL